MEQAQLTLDQVLEYIENRPDTTRTYQVPQGVIAALPLTEPPHMRLLDASEIQELADYLDTSPSSLKGPFKVFDATCSSCARRITFLDFAKTAVDLGMHAKEALRDVLTGKNGEWITIRGRDGGRPVACAQCGHDVPRLKMNGSYSEYSSSSYAYA
ncbi:hypothetical protein ACFXGI_02125 [Streptomyces sp. NPDC059355]|uniref:hypothetical protein n=1 Tax=Streptomyces sp. NPDC059355 TaxID=3346811 RepID=UPI0036AEA4A9